MSSFPYKAFNESDCGGYGLPNSSACTSMIWKLKNSSYNPEPYIGSVCRSYLLAWQDCAVGPMDSDIIVINASQDQTENEQLAVETYQVIS